MRPPEFIDTITQARGQPHNSWSPKIVRNLNIARDYLHQHQHALRRLRVPSKRSAPTSNEMDTEMKESEMEGRNKEQMTNPSKIVPERFPSLTVREEDVLAAAR